MSEQQKKPENIPAFPLIDEIGNYIQEGMSLRDYFANSAMLGILSNGLNVSEEQAQEAYNCVAINSYLMADSMLKERLK